MIWLGFNLPGVAKMINYIEDLNKKEIIEIIRIQQEEFAVLLGENKAQADRIAELEERIAELECMIESY